MWLSSWHTAPSSSDEAPPSDEICTICQYPLDAAAERLSGCHHRFHARCIIAALQHNRACPNCRYAPEAPGEGAAPRDAADTDGTDDEAPRGGASHGDAARRAARARAIRSTIVRDRHGTASARVHMSLRTYRDLAVRIGAKRRELAAASRRLRAARTRLRCAFRVIVREYHRTKRSVDTSARRLTNEMHLMESRRASLGDALACAAGFTRTPSPPAG